MGASRKEGSGAGEESAAPGSRGTSVGLTERLRDALRGEGDGDLLLDRGDMENGVLQWLRALDAQVIGACRADERLRPLPKLAISTGLAEDMLMAQLTQHFEASEVGMIARCLCIPLVSLRVGKITRQENLLCPTPTRGRLNLTLLPSSNMRITFSGDDGCNERLATVCSDSESSAVTIEEISSDSSGRSFLLKLPDSVILYFWCSEKSKLRGMELLWKMKDLLKRKPSLAHLTGISDSRLDSFASHLRAYLLASTNSAEATNSTAPSSTLQRTATSSLHQSNNVLQTSSTPSKSSRFRLTAGHTAKVHTLYQGSLSPRSNTFKEGLGRSSASSKNGAKEKLRRRCDTHPNISTNNRASTSESAASTTYVPSSQFEDEKLPNGSIDSCYVQPCLPDILCLPSSIPLFTSSSHLLPSKVTDPSSLFSPYYCWCPPCHTAPQSTITSHLPLTESLPLPPLSSLLSVVGPPMSPLPSKLHNDATELSNSDISNLFSNPLIHFPFPVSSLVTIPNSQQIPTFTPLMSDPIVHIPVIDVCSSGQGYLVSAGPTISSAIPPLLPGSPLIPKSESLVEKSARETLRMLMGSAPISTSPELINVLPAVFGSIHGNFAQTNGDKHAGVLSGRSLFSESAEIDDVANRLASTGLSGRGGSTSGGCNSSSKLTCDVHKEVDGYSCAEDNTQLD